jgi:hypothetical protein
MFAEACDPLQGEIPEGGASFVRSHRIDNLTEGEISVQDQLVIWGRQEDSFCFFLATTHRNLHHCWLRGTATRQSKSTFGYQDDNCKVLFHLSGKRVLMRVGDQSDPTRKGCNPADTNEYSCGMNTWIPTATYLQE